MGHLCYIARVKISFSFQAWQVYFCVLFFSFCMRPERMQPIAILFIIIICMQLLLQCLDFRASLGSL